VKEILGGERLQMRGEPVRVFLTRVEHATRPQNNTERVYSFFPTARRIKKRA
jgi:hypothetical protein